MVQVLLSALLRYLENNPAAVDQLVAQAVTAITNALAQHNATAGKS